MAQARRTCAGIQARATPVPRMCDREDRLRSALQTRRSRARARAMAVRCDAREGRAGGRARGRRRRDDDRSGQARCHQRSSGRCPAFDDHARHDARRSLAGRNGSGCNEPCKRCAFAAAGPFASSTAGMALARDGAGAGAGGQRCRWSMQPATDIGPQHASAQHGAVGSLRAVTD